MAEGAADLSAPDGAHKLAQQVRAVVGATKGAIDTLVKQFAAQLGPRGIRVNAVAPGVVDTDMSSFVKKDAGRKAAVDMQALPRVARAEDIGPVVAFLASVPGDLTILLARSNYLACQFPRPPPPWRFAIRWKRRC